MPPKMKMMSQRARNYHPKSIKTAGSEKHEKQKSNITKAPSYGPVSAARRNANVKKQEKAGTRRSDTPLKDKPSYGAGGFKGGRRFSTGKKIPPTPGGSMRGL